MTEKEIRARYVKEAREYIGMKMGDDEHRFIVNTYNSTVPLPRNYRVTYTDSYCMTFVSAIAILCGLEDIFPIECGCGEAQRLCESMGIWNEDDAYIPEPGDLIMFDWRDGGKGDCIGWPRHVAIVDHVDMEDELICMINPNDAEGGVSELAIPLDGKTIRGFVKPDYALIADPPAPVVTGRVLTDLYMRTAPCRVAQKCNIEKQDGRGIRNVLYEGEEVEIIAEMGGWYQIRVTGRLYEWTPWCSGKYVEVIKDGGTERNDTDPDA